jgi:hypothetical protein
MPGPLTALTAAAPIAALLAVLSAAACAEPVPLFDGTDLSAWTGPGGGAPGWTIEDGVLVVSPGSGSIETRAPLGSGRLHIEFFIPESPDELTGQARGNSGVYLQNRYEIQILDSAGAAPDAGMCGAVYSLTPPAVNAAAAAGAWQTYDIDFTAPTFDDGGKKTAPARVTVLHNGVTIHDNVEIAHPTGAAAARPEVAAAPLVLQDHGAKIRFRNITFDQRPDDAAPPEAAFKPIFDGRTLEGWEKRGGNAIYAAAGGIIVGETRPGGANSFLCTSRTYSDFELDLMFRVEPELNSGVQIRSHARPDGVVHGYKVEIDPSSRAWTCGLYDESGRGWIDDLTDNPPAQKAFKPNEWNHMRVVAIGHHVRTWLNGVPAADVVDEQGDLSGFFALQVHAVGARTDPLAVRWKDLRVRDRSAPAAD